MTPLDLIQAIARSVEVGHTGRLRDLPRREIIDRCRQMCDDHGLGYSQKDLQPARTDDPRTATIRSKVTRTPNVRTPKRYAAVERLLAGPDGLAGRRDRPSRPRQP